MLKIVITFAELERETIQMRVTDAYIARSRKGFYMGGRIPYGYTKEPYMIDGKKTSRYVVDQNEAEVVKLIYSLYAEPQTSYGYVVNYLNEHGIKNNRREDGAWDRCRIAEMVKNPIYVKADLAVYRFYKDQGTNLHNSPEDYLGIFGLYLYSDKSAGRKQCHLEGQHIVLAPHEGIVPSDIWLKARMKCLNNKQVTKPYYGCNTWLIGKVKCGKCGYALTIRKCKLKTRTRRYFICSKRMQTNKCEGVGGIDADVFEPFILEQMKDHLKEIETLSSGKKAKADPRIFELNAKIEAVSVEIGKLLDKLADANDVLMDYINKRVKELDDQINVYRQQIKELSPLQNGDPIDTKQLKNYMDHWNELSNDDKRSVVDQLILVIKATEDSCEITWRF